MMTRSFSEVIHLILAAGWRRRFLICVPLLMLPLIGFAVGKLAPKTYEARMTILIQEPAKLNSDRGQSTSETDLSKRMPVLEALIRSSRIMGAVAADFGLVSPSMSERERKDVINRLSSNLTINLIGESWIELTVRGSSKNTLSAQLGQIGNRFIAELVGPERSSLASSVKFLQLQTELRELLLRATEKDLLAFKERNAERLPELHADNLKRLVELEQLLENRRTALSNATAEVTDLRSTLGATSPVVQQLEGDIIRLSGELALLRSTYTEKHPSVQAITRQLRFLEEQRTNAIAMINAFVVGNVERSLPLTAEVPRLGNQPPLLAPLQLEKWQAAKRQQAILQEEITQLQHTVARLQAIVSSQPGLESELVSLERDVGAQRDAYEKLATLLNTEQMGQELGSSVERSKIIDAPQQPEPIGPSAREFALAGVLGGFILGFCLVVAAELSDSSVRRRADLERITGKRLLARIPAMPTESQTVAAPDPQTGISNRSPDIRSTGS